MKSTALLIVTICLLAAACQKKKYPEEQVQLGHEAIYFNGSVDNSPVSLKIGTDGYYCYASYQQTADSMYVFKGDLKKFNCNPCPLSLQLELTDYRKRAPGAAVPVDSTFRAGSRRFIPGMPLVSILKFQAYSNKDIAALRWNMSNGFSSTDSVISAELMQPGPQTVSLTLRTTGNCESMVVSRIFVGGASGLLACGITAETGQNNSAQFHASIMGGTPPFRYTWTFGDNSSSNLPAPTHAYQWAGGYPVKLRIEDAEQHVCESNYICVAGNDKSSCSTNMKLSYLGNRDAFSNGVRLQWTDASNVMLRSDSISQPNESYFEILNAQPYEANEKGESGRLLTLRFNVLLAKGSRKVWLKSENTVMAVTYK